VESPNKTLGLGIAQVGHKSPARERGINLEGSSEDGVRQGNAWPAFGLEQALAGGPRKVKELEDSIAAQVAAQVAANVADRFRDDLARLLAPRTQRFWMAAD